MKAYSFVKDGLVFNRVTKKAAKAAYENGQTVVFCPVNLRPGEPYHPEVFVKKEDGSVFENVLNAFEYYNLNGKETGTYTAFYVQVA